MYMSFDEFIEGFSRIAEKLSPLPLDEDPEKWSEE